MIRQQEFNIDLADIAELFRIGADHHSIFRRSGACRHNAALFHFDKTETACAVHTQIRVIAERREFNPGLTDHLKKIALSLDLDRNTVDGKSFYSSCSHFQSSLSIKFR